VVCSNRHYLARLPNLHRSLEIMVSHNQQDPQGREVMGHGGVRGDLAKSVFLQGFTIVFSSDSSGSSSLWVFYFYWNRRPVFREDLVGKNRDSLEGVNILWFKSPDATQKWLQTLQKALKS
jgi:hypothetical protein